MQLPLFVFGTLRFGHVNHHYLHGRYERSLPAVLHGFARIHPLMIVRRPDAEVDGELYFIRTDIYEATLRHCDDLEEIPPGRLAGPEYRRMQVDVETEEGAYRAWAYVHPETRDE